jgi:hypothetical protein
MWNTFLARDFIYTSPNHNVMVCKTIPVTTYNVDTCYYTAPGGQTVLRMI